MNRRRLLGVLAGGLGASTGCLAGRDGAPITTTAGTDAPGGRGPTTATDAPTTADASTTTDGATGPAVRVSAVAVTPELVALNTPDSIGTYGDRGEQYVVATAAATGSPAPAFGEFVLAAGGTDYPADEDAGGMGRRLWDRGLRYDTEDDPSGWLAFPVPKPLDVESATITWPGGEHALAGEAVAELARPPTDWTVREFAAPDVVTPGDEATVSLTVANAGDADGTFVAALNRAGPSVAYIPVTTISLEVPAGGTASWQYGHPVGGRDAGDDVTMQFHLAWRGGRSSREIDVRED